MGRFDNLGSQHRSFYYNQGLISSEFNRIFSKTMPAGIYEGGEIERIDDYRFKVHPMSVIIEDANISQDPSKDVIGNDIAVRIRTTKITEPLSLAQPVDVAKCLVVARYSWLSDNPANIPTNYDPGKGYMDIVVVTEELDVTHSDSNSLWTTDLILGKLNFYNNGGSYGIHQSSPVDYTRKSWSPVVSDLIQSRLRVRSPRVTENQKKVYIESGFVRGLQGIYEVSGSSPELSNTGTFARVDYVYVDENGEIKVEEGVQGSNPVPKPFYGRKVLAEIRRGPHRDSVRGDEIFQTATTPISTLRASTLDVKNDEEYFETDTYGFLTIEEALKQLWEKSIAYIVPESKVFRHPDGTRFEREDKKDAVVIQGRDGGNSGRSVKITPAALTGDRTVTLADGNTTLTPGKMVSDSEEQVITGKKEFRNTGGTVFKSANGKTGIIIKGNSVTSDKNVTITQETLSGNRTVTLPDADVVLAEGTMLSTDTDQEVTGEKEFSTYPLLTNENPPSNDLHAVRKIDLDNTVVELSDHRSLTTESSAPEVPHGIRQGHNNGFDADKLDGAHKSTNATLSGNSDNNIPTEKAVKTYVDQRLSRSAGSGQQLNGTLYTQSLRPDTNDSKNIGTDSVRYKNGYFSGTVKSGSFDITSSREKKEAIENYLNSGLEIIDSLQIVTFKYKSDEDERTHIGIIAEDSPMEILANDGKALSLADSVGVLFKAVQELSTKVKDLEKRLEK